MPIRIAQAVLTVAAVAWILLPARALAAEQVLEKRLVHLRSTGEREWNDFPDQAAATQLEIRFNSQANPEPQTLQLRQQDAKQLWRVRLNDREIGQLHRDENDLRVYFAIPPQALQEGANTLVIAQDRGAADDVRVGDVRLDSRPLPMSLGECTVAVQVLDAETERNLPARITLLSNDGAMQTVDCTASPHLAVRPGTIYTATGEAAFRVPAGGYVLHAGRGFEYSLASADLHLQPGQNVSQTLRIRREVPTPGYVACDPHIHTLTHSGHGDATVMERMVTIAAEGVELAVATDHNRHVDHTPFAESAGVRNWFTTVIGNEVTTPVGHFNIFPVPAGAAVPNHQLTGWEAIFDEIARTTHAPIVILNHARDLHSGIRPFGPKHFLAATVRSTDGWPQRMNGMEVVNSGATQTDVLQLFRDWMNLLNRGVPIAPVGSSDSHDVARLFVGQGRTYIRCDDARPGQIDVAAAVDSFRRGSVRVSYGLLAELQISGQTSGDVVTVKSDTVTIDARVLGPHWVTASQIELYVNGQLLRTQPIAPTDAREVGVKWSGSWILPKPKHDVHVVAIARGPGIAAGYWATAKPYQPTSTRAATQIIGCSGAIWLDADGDGSATSAREYAASAWKASDGDLTRLLARLSDFDAAVAAQAAEQYHLAGNALTAPAAQAALKDAAPAIRAGFDQYLAAWRDHEIAQTQTTE